MKKFMVRINTAGKGWRDGDKVGGEQGAAAAAARGRRASPGQWPGTRRHPGDRLCPGAVTAKRGRGGRAPFHQPRQPKGERLAGVSSTSAQIPADFSVSVQNTNKLV